MSFEKSTRVSINRKSMINNNDVLRGYPVLDGLHWLHGQYHS
jgi:hypothetical protein